MHERTVEQYLEDCAEHRRQERGRMVWHEYTRWEIATIIDYCSPLNRDEAEAFTVELVRGDKAENRDRIRDAIEKVRVSRKRLNETDDHEEMAEWRWTYQHLFPLLIEENVTDY